MVPSGILSLGAAHIIDFAHQLAAATGHQSAPALDAVTSLINYLAPCIGKLVRCELARLRRRRNKPKLKRPAPSSARDAGSGTRVVPITAVKMSEASAVISTSPPPVIAKPSPTPLKVGVRKLVGVPGATTVSGPNEVDRL